MAGDVGRLVRLQVSYTDGGGTAETVVSRSLTVVAGGSGQVTAFVEVTDRTAVEGTGDVAGVSVRLDSSLLAGESVTVPWSFAGATAGTDFRLSGSAAGVAVSDAGVVFTGPASASVRVWVSALPDGDSVSERVTLSLGEMSASGSALEGASLTAVLVGSPLLVLAEPGAVRTADVVLSRSAVAEGGSVAVTVRLRQGPLSTDVSVPLAVSGSGVTAGEYRLVSPVVVPAGFSEVSTELVVVDDGVVEGSESWTVGLGSLPAGLNAGATGVLAVTDRAAAAGGELLVEAASLDSTVDYRVDGSVGQGLVRIVLSRALASGEKLVVPLGFTGGVLGADFTLGLLGSPAGVSLSGSTVTFTGPSASVADLAVFGVDDADHAAEQVSVTVGTPTKTAITDTVTARSSASFVVADDMSAVPAGLTPVPDAGVAVTVSSVDPTALEGSQSAGGRLRVGLSRALASGESLAVPLTFAGAVRGTDFSLSLVGSPAGVSLSGSTVTFTGPAAKSADLAVVAAQDADSVSERVTVGVGTPVATGIDGGATASSSAFFVLDDNDIPALRVIGAGALSVSEPSGSAGYTLSLASRPSGSVTVTPAAGDGVSVSGAVTFTPSDWTNKSVTVTVVDDSTDQPRRTARITHTVASTADAQYDGIDAPVVSVTVVDDDKTVASLARVDSGGVDEAGTTAADRQAVFTVTLNRALASGEAAVVPVVFSGAGITAGDFTLSLDTAGGRSAGVSLARGTLSAGLRFANGAQTAHLVVTAVADNVDEAAESLSVALGAQALFDSVTQSVDGGVGPASGSAAVVVPVADGDAPLVVTLSGGSSTAIDEGDSTSTVSLTVTLSRALAAGQKLSVPLTFAGGRLGDEFTLALSGSPSGVKLAQNTVTFTGPSATTATLAASAADDADADDEQITVTIPKTAAGFTYEGLADTLTGAVSGTVRINVADDDEGSVLSRSTVPVTEGGSATYTVRLASRPAGKVTVTPQSGDASVVSVSAPLVFNVSDWNQPKTVTVTAADNAVDDPGAARTVTVTHSVAPASASDLGIEVGDVTVTVADDEATTVTVAAAATAILETGGTTEVTVTLSRALVAGERVDVPLTVTGTGITAADYTLTLKTATSSVNVGVAVSSAAPLSGTAPVLEFTEGAQTATLVLSAAGDGTDESPGETVTVALAAQSVFDAQAGTSVAGGAAPDPDGPASASVEIVDDDGAAGVRVVETGGGTRVAEVVSVSDTDFDTDEYLVRLTAAPTGTVTVTASVSGLGLSDAPGGSYSETRALTFDASNWWKPQTVVVRGDSDRTDHAEESLTRTITHTVSGYTGVSTAPSVVVTVVDAPTVVSLSGGGTVTEGDTTSTADITITLGRAPAHGETVDVPIRVSSTTQARLGGPSRLRPLTWRVLSGANVSVVGDPLGRRQLYGIDLVVRFSAKDGIDNDGDGDIDEADELTPTSSGATIRFAATDVDDDEADEIVDITIGAGLNSPSRSTKFTGGLAAHSTSNTARITIDDDDEAAAVPEAVFGSASFTATEAASSRTVMVPVTLTPAPDAAVTVNYSIGGTATSGDDFTALSGTVTVGTSGTANIAVVVVDDDVHDGPAETVVLTITDDAAYSTGTVSVSTVTITDDETLPEVTLVLTPDVVSESGSPVDVTATLDHASDEELVLTVASDGAAATLSNNKTLTIAAGATVSTGTVTLTPNDDSTDTPERRVDVSASASGGNGIEDPDGDFLFVTDDDPTTVTLSRAAGTSVAEGSTHVYTIRLNRALASSEALAVRLTFSGSATRGTDYTLAGTPATGVSYGNLNSSPIPGLVFQGGSGASAVATITLTAVADNSEEADGGDRRHRFGHVDAHQLDRHRRRQRRRADHHRRHWLGR